MSTVPTYVLRLPKTEMLRPRALERLVARALDGVRADLRRVLSCFAFRADEAVFARELLRRRSQMWLFRSNQRRFCGDFVVVDMSSPVAERRRAWVLDLKMGAPLRVGGGGAGVQLQNAPLAVAEVAQSHGALGLPAQAERLTGDRRALLAYFGVHPPRL